MPNGSVEVICGGMFSGKTEELLRRIRREQYARRKIQLFKHGLDQRYTEGHVESHSSLKLPSEEVATAQDLIRQVKEETRVVGIDEVQFFDDEIVAVANHLADRGVRVIVAGLDTDYKGVPFGPMPHLMAIAEDVTKIRAVCVLCGGPASRSHRLSREGDQVQVGATDVYEARCRSCDALHVCPVQSTTTSYETTH
ncbi:thymidine kinase [Candidatus Uhrbacteria bacterium CG10_big_fil_rev_8_21_14_0_10_50_16]|uniref:Thymidine kinase n=1 Tax=Candidatus Uhrbacteria bacterium CG10_big_fil_rev_8_21_14_0_10_50_16 TaxID=1975039 RepID=A0A2H0RN01_9BACT|nr:MAG: thymidine kinase [Candidatus Uhrbacteria bacterium CG10_big_fil_rev_8_21_14_0_10_50_16]